MSMKSPIWFSIWRNCPAWTAVSSFSILVFLQQIQPGPLALKPALGHVFGLRVIEAAILVGLDELSNQLSAVDGQLAQLILVVAINRPSKPRSPFSLRRETDWRRSAKGSRWNWRAR